MDHGSAIRRYTSLGLMLASGWLAMPALAQEAGYTPGEFSVDPAGAATYQVPLRVPPGAAGMQPELAFLYHSRAGNGQLGVGWSLSGLSAISRCAAIRDSEGVTRSDGVTLSITDRFCLDGQMLRHQSGTYGANGVRYFTEVESFQEVFSYGTTNGAPTRFEVTDRAGLKRFYGQTTDSRITSVGDTAGVPIIWALNRIEDKLGNYITFSYGRDATLGEYWPSEIKWFNRNNVTLGRVVLSYTANRQDKSYGFGFGRTKQALTRRLSTVQVYEGQSNAVRRYGLNYQQAPYSALSRLISIQECAGTGAPCLPATTFAWENGQQGFIHSPIQQVGPVGSNVKMLDVNGDGRLDLVQRSGSTIRIFFAGGTEATSTVPAGSSMKFEDAVVLDYNGDGLMDLLVANTTSGNWDLYRSTGSNFAYQTTSRPHHNAYSKHPAAFDVTGNGVPELFFKRLGKIWIYLGADAGGFQATPLATDWTVADGQKFMPLEFDGDGLTDILVTYDGCQPADGGGGGGGGGGGVIIESAPGGGSGVDIEAVPDGGLDGGAYVIETQSSSSTTCGMTSGPLRWNAVTSKLERPWADVGVRHHKQPILLDINGDGLTDIVSIPPYGTQIQVSLNHGGRWVSEWTGLSDYQWTKAVVLDWNLDGRDDLLVARPDGYFTALTFRTNELETVATGLASSSAAYLTADWNGNGLADLWHISGSNWRVSRHRGQKAGHLTRIQNGLGDELAIGYAALSDGYGTALSVYEGHVGSDAYTTSPRLRNFLGPVFVVGSYAADAGIDTAGGGPQKVVTRYRYAGAKVNTHGRGFLGFRRVRATNENTHIVTENVHFQEFPYTGMLKEARQRMPDTTSVQELPWEAWEDWFNENCAYPYTQQCQGPPPPTVIVEPGPVISETSNTVAKKTLGATGQGRVYFPHLDTSTELSFDFAAGGGSTIYRRTETVYLYDNNGNPTQIVATVDNGAGGDVHTTTTVNQYNHTAACPSRLTQSTVTQVAPSIGGHGTLNRSRTATFGYHPIHCQLTMETSNAGTAAALTKTYTYDVFGNRHTETITGAGITPARVMTTNFDPNGRYLVGVVNPAGHTQSFSWHQGFGRRLSATDANGLTVSWKYDDFGREKEASGPRSLQRTDTTWAGCGSGGCQHPEAVLKVTRTGGGIATEQTLSVTELDRLGREVAAGERNVQGHMTYALTFFDPAGRPYANSGPYRPGVDNGACWTVRHYDPLGRVRHEYAAADPAHCNGLLAPPIGAAPTGWSHTQMTYTGLTTAVTDPEGRQREQIANVMDRVRYVREHDGTTWRQTEYRYDGHGNTTRVQDAAGAVTNSWFDDAGRKTSMLDANMGSWSYAYNAAGELISQTDANSVTVSMTYDVLGRIKTRSEPEGTTTWTYDNTAHGPARGKVTDITGLHGYRERFWYTSAGGELLHSARYIGDTWFWTRYDYNDLGQVLQIRYPSVDCAVPCSSTPPDAGRLRVDHYYRYGHLYLVRERKPDGSTGTSYWEALEVDALGSVTREKLGNNLFTQRYVNPATGLVETITTGGSGNAVIQDLAMEWDRVGNLETRIDANAVGNGTPQNPEGRQEGFVYDGLGRLKTVTLRTAGGSLLGSESVNYGASGNINSKGIYTNYQYNLPDRPQQVSAVTTPAGTRGYSYNANGNLTQVTGPGARTVTWWSFNKPRRMEKDGNNHAEYWYGPGGDRAMFRQSARIAGQTVLTLYGGALYERRHAGGAATQHTHHIQANGRTVATVHRSGTSTTNTTRYLHKDHLGSVVAITSETGTIVESLAYDAWGKRRPATTWQTPNPGVFMAAITLTRGFTMHEHLDQVGLIHMGGRVYDPEIGRFLSPDPFVQFPISTQGFNRYAYVSNNPLSYTDPSGYFVKGLMKAIGIGINFVPGFQGWGGAIMQGFISGYMVTAGDPRAAAVGAMGGAIFHGIGNQYGEVGFGSAQHVQKTLAHGMAGGLLSAAGGGRFGDGFLGAAAGQAMAPAIDTIGMGPGGQIATDPASRIARVMSAAAVGGTASTIGGGKFANGAISAGFARAMNDAARQAAGPPRRELTANEIAAAQSVFGDRIDYSNVRVIDGKYVFFQGKGYAMAPDGNIYWPGVCSDLATCEGAAYAGTFIHEMTHVMQHQHGVSVLGRGFLLQAGKFMSFGLYNPYSYTYDPSRSFSSYNIEQQGDIARGIYYGRYRNNIGH